MNTAAGRITKNRMIASTRASHGIGTTVNKTPSMITTPNSNRLSRSELNRCSDAIASARSLWRGIGAAVPCCAVSLSPDSVTVHCNVTAAANTARKP